jgi:hypothetical protein
MQAPMRGKECDATARCVRGAETRCVWAEGEQRQAYGRIARELVKVCGLGSRDKVRVGSERQAREKRQVVGGKRGSRDKVCVGSRGAETSVREDYDETWRSAKHEAMRLRQGCTRFCSGGVDACVMQNGDNAYLAQLAAADLREPFSGMLRDG